MVMRSGKRMVCLKLRRSDDEGMQYVSYADDGNRWDVAPKIPGDKQGSANGEGSSSESIGRAYWESGKDGEAPKGMQQLPNMVNDEYINAHGGAGFSGAGNGCQTQGNSLCTSTSDKSNYAKSPYPNYKYGSGFENQKAESLSIELGTDADVDNLTNAFNLVQIINKRSMLKTAKDTLIITNFPTKDDMELLVMAERERELCFEGKRWFDLLRYCYRGMDGVDINETLNSQASAPKLRKQMTEFITRKYKAGEGDAVSYKMDAEPYLYWPVSETELKVNNLLNQNPVWIQEKSTSKN
jgi:hypothetical protein